MRIVGTQNKISFNRPLERLITSVLGFLKADLYTRYEISISSTKVDLDSNRECRTIYAPSPMNACS